MAVADCIRKFVNDIDLDKLKSIAKGHEEQGMSPDSAFIRAATEEQTRLMSERTSTLDLAGVKQEAIPAKKEDVSADQFTKQAARGIIENDPTMTVMDENGNAVVAKDLLDQAETKFQQETKEADLFKVAVACAIGVGE